MPLPKSAPSVRVIIVDDTRSIRAMIRALLLRDPRIEVVGEAGDPYEARELIRELNPDVITLDVVMPKMDGLSFLERLMRLRPMPVVMISTRTTEKSAAAVKALSLGAFDCVDIAALSQGKTNTDLAEVVVAAASSNPRGRTTQRTVQASSKRFRWNGRAVLFGSSTGGVDALTTVLSEFPKDCPPVLIAQHMPRAFLESFCTRLERIIAPKVCLAEDGAPLEQGVVQLGPGGGTHVALADSHDLRVELLPEDGSELYVPSVNVLFSSAQVHAKRVVAVMLTGMGKDGSKPMLELYKAGAYTIAQDSASSVVDGMPKAARDIGAVVEFANFNKIASAILAQVSKPEQESA